jgi:DeoR/GlpR family transcriptional regulator of sugar metabolism
MRPALSDDSGIEKRREEILDILKDEGKAKVTELSKRFNISEVTIRNDLTELEKEGLLKRMHGGAVSTQKAYYNMSLNDRMSLQKSQKQQIGKKAASFVNEGDTLMLLSGTTTYYVAKELLDIKNITVVTNSLTIAQELSFCKYINVILLGGNLDPQYQFTYGNDAINQLQKYRADMMIASVDGISADKGMTTYHYLESEVTKQMMARSNKVLVAADYTKIGREGFAFIDSAEKADILVTDDGAQRKETEKLALLLDVVKAGK